jgi:hypothetical protein
MRGNRRGEVELERATVSGAVALASDPSAAKLAAGGAVIGGAFGHGLGRGLGSGLGGAIGEHLSDSVEQLVRCIDGLPANVRKELMDGASIQGLVDDIKRDADHLIESVGIERQRLELSVQRAGRRLIDEIVLKLTVVCCIAAVAVLATKLPHLASAFHDPSPLGVARLWAFVITPGWVMFLLSKVGGLVFRREAPDAPVLSSAVFLQALLYISGFGAIAAALVAMSGWLAGM